MISRIWNAVKHKNRERIINLYRSIPFSKRSYSQCAEDIIIKNIFVSNGIQSIFYLDIGTNHPIAGSNTFLMYSLGSNGVCVEANPILIPLIKRFRPRDIVMNIGVGIGGTLDSLPFYSLDDDQLSTFSKEQADWCVSQGNKLLDVSSIPMMPINKVLESCGVVPNLLSIDVEGLDLSILQEIDFDRFPIGVICVEVQVHKNENRIENRAAIENLLGQHNYIVYGRAGVNTIFVRPELKYW
jgi:FkbM family methyltransferase